MLESIDIHFRLGLGAVASAVINGLCQLMVRWRERTLQRLSQPLALTFYIILPVGIGPRENHVPEARNLSFGLVCPGKVAIVTIKSFRKNLKSKENARDRRGKKFPGHLRIFDIGRFA